jgi:hypothetical protein
MALSDFYFPVRTEVTMGIDRKIFVSGEGYQKWAPSHKKCVNCFNFQDNFVSLRLQNNGAVAQVSR